MKECNIMVRWFKRFLEKLVAKERHPRVLALSFCIGIYIAFSPFVGLHTVMTLAAGWLFSLNLAAMFGAAYLVNNPWTMVPVYMAGYLVGDYLLALVGIDGVSLNPSWMSWINEPIHRYTGIEGISFWGFMIGGNLLGILFGVILYPIMIRLFTTISQKMYKKLDESNCSK